MSAITTHVLDTSIGQPAIGVEVHLEVQDGTDVWRRVGRGATDDDGRLRTLLDATAALAPGTYRLVFQTAAYFGRRGVATFFPHVSVAFSVSDGAAHYHVPLLISPYSYTIYRGS
jgi:5-hydroxyisourate hydrolase